MIKGEREGGREGVGWVGVDTVIIVVVSSVQGKHMPSAGGSLSLSVPPNFIFLKKKTENQIEKSTNFTHSLWTGGGRGRVLKVFDNHNVRRSTSEETNRVFMIMTFAHLFCQCVLTFFLNIHHAILCLSLCFFPAMPCLCFLTSSELTTKASPL